MASRTFSRGAAKALQLIERNRKGDIQQAIVEIDRELAASAARARKMGDHSRNKSVKARVLVEHWRNGWGDTGVLDQAQSFAFSGQRSDEGDYYTHWSAAYALKYRARSRGWGQLGEALAHYARALAALSSDEPSNNEALRGLLIDRAETLVYLSQADLAVSEMQRALKLGGTPKDWHVWAYAFALHQNGDFKKSASQLAPFLKGKADSNLYYNDMRLLLAASLARAGKSAQAQDTIRTFRRLRDQEGEPVWTVSLELERGAFYPESPGEKHWRESLELLDAGALPR